MKTTIALLFLTGCLLIGEQGFAQKNKAVDQVTFHTVHRVKSKTGVHELFQQYFQKIPVYNVYQKCLLQGGNSSCTLLQEELILDESLWITYQQAQKVTTNQEPVFVYENGEYRLCKLETAFLNKDYPVSILWGYDAVNHEPLYLKRLYAMNHDSAVSCAVYNPNPIVSSNTIYGSPLVDNSDQNSIELTQARSFKNTVVSFNEITKQLELENASFKLVDVSLPAIPVPLFTATPLDYTRDEDEFEAINAFYHLNAFMNYVQDSLGYDALLNQQVEIDVHALNGQDNSLFRTAGNPQILFGNGGVDDAEDGQVVVHELAHAILFFATGGTNSGVERNAIEEAVADYLAASYSKSIDEFNWENIPSWDGHNEFWDGRVVNSSKVYPADFFNNIYLDAEIWSSTMMKIEEVLGRKTTNELQLESSFFYHQGMTMPQAGEYLLKADSLLNSGKNSVLLAERLCAKGLLLNCNQFIESYDEVLTVDFNQLGQRIIRFSASIKTFDQLEVYDTSGKRCMNDHGDLQFSYAVPSLSSGIYFLKLSNSATQKVIKIILL